MRRFRMEKLRNVSIVPPDISWILKDPLANHAQLELLVIQVDQLMNVKMDFTPLNLKPRAFNAQPVTNARRRRNRLRLAQTDFLRPRGFLNVWKCPKTTVLMTRKIFKNAPKAWNLYLGSPSALVIQRKIENKIEYEGRTKLGFIFYSNLTKTNV